MSERDEEAGHGSSVHLASGADDRDDLDVFWRRPRPALTERDVDDMFHALWEIKKDTQLILAILRDEEDDDDEL